MRLRDLCLLGIEAGPGTSQPGRMSLARAVQTVLGVGVAQGVPRGVHTLGHGLAQRLGSLNWLTPQARGAELWRVGLAQVGTARLTSGETDEWIRCLVRLTIQRLLPLWLRAVAAPRATAELRVPLEAAATACEVSGSGDAAAAAARAAQSSDALVVRELAASAAWAARTSPSPATITTIGDVLVGGNTMWVDALGPILGARSRTTAVEIVVESYRRMRTHGAARLDTLDALARAGARTPLELFQAQEIRPLVALTIHQPWASAMFAGRPVESRQRHRGGIPLPQIKPGQWLGIHAGLSWHAWAAAAYRTMPHLPPDEELPRGALLGAVRVLGWLSAAKAAQVPELAPWVFPDPALYYLRHDPAQAVRYGTPIPWSGAQGVWHILPRTAATEGA